MASFLVKTNLFEIIFLYKMDMMLFMTRDLINNHYEPSK